MLADGGDVVLWGFLGAGNGIPMSDCFIGWFWAGFAADAAVSYNLYKSSIYFLKVSLVNIKVNIGFISILLS